MGFEETLRSLLREELGKLDDKLRGLEKRLENLRSSNDVYLTPEQAARVAGVTAPTVRSWVKAGSLNRYMAGREMRIKSSELEAYMAGHHVSAPTDADLDSKAISIVSRLGGRR